jgi:hypothetical protein
MTRLARLFAAVLFVALIASACGSDEPAASDIPVYANGFPSEWPIATPPGNLNDCDNATISQDDSMFAVVMCLPDDPNPFTASENYLATLEADGFAEREPGSFITRQQTFLDGNGIEIFYQLVDNEATIVLIKPG